MSLITLFEYEQLTNTTLKSRIGAIPISKFYDQIAQLNGEEKVELIKIGHRGLQATQYVGVLRLGETTIQVLPKIDYSVQSEPEATDGFYSKEIQIETSTRNLLYLLSYAYDLPLHEHNLAQLFHRRSEWFELLTRFFAESLHSQIRHGLDHTYVTLEDILPVLRGRWLLYQQITRHPRQRLLFDVQFDEFLANTPLNRIFRYVSEQLLVRSTDPTNRRMLIDICQWLADVGRITKPERSHLEQVVFTRLNDRFRPSFNLARLFLEQSVIQLS
jgi:5-methylcytosine-specific restriction enzyme subunit McrC